LIKPEHLVLGLLTQRDELAAEVLAELGVSAEAARTLVAQRLGGGAPRPAGSLGASPQAKRLLELAGAIAKSLGNRCPKTEHILLAVTSSKLHSPAATLLADCGAHADRIRRQLTRMLVRRRPNSPNAFATAPSSHAPGCDASRHELGDDADRRHTRRSLPHGDPIVVELTAAIHRGDLNAPRADARRATSARDRSHDRPQRPRRRLAHSFARRHRLAGYLPAAPDTVAMLLEAGADPEEHTGGDRPETACAGRPPAMT
jgi:hypothetical protein